MPEPKNWFAPDNLLAIQEDVAVSDLAQVREKGDFGAYATLNRLGELSPELSSHNCMRGSVRAAMYGWLLRRRRIASIADFGCGVGITTQALARRFPQATTHGYEVSSEGVAAAARHFPGPTYVQSALAPDSDLGRRFDFLLAQEFYPFTRTDDWTVHRDYLALLVRHLTPGGTALIVLSERTPATILARMEQLGTFCRDSGLRLRSLRLPSDRLFSRIPVYPAAHVLTALIPEGRYWRNRCLILARAR